MDKKLKPCPFCGGEAETLTSYFSVVPVCYVHCCECKAEGPVFGTEKKAVEAWNTRV